MPHFTVAISATGLLRIRAMTTDPTPDLSPEAVIAEAEWIERNACEGGRYHDAAATLRALSAALEASRQSDAESVAMYHRARDRADEWRARAERAEAALVAEQSDAAAARKRVQELIAEFNRQVERTDEQRAAYEAALSRIEAETLERAALVEALAEALQDVIDSDPDCAAAVARAALAKLR
jgi:chromosome segregation ATPase